MTELKLAHFERAEFDGEQLTLTGQDDRGNPVVIKLGLPQYTALTMDVGFAMLKTQPLRQASGGLQELAVIQATDTGLAFDALQNAPILVFRHGQGRQSAFLVPRSKARGLAELLLSQIEADLPAAPTGMN